MPIFKEAGPEAREKLLNRSKGFQQRQVYRDMLSGLTDGQTIEVQPEEGETLRKIKVNVRRAANELGLSIRYGETTDATLLVWPEAGRPRQTRRGRPRKQAQEAI